MIRTRPLVDCAGCGAVVDPSKALPFRCPNAESLPQVDHVLTPRPDAQDFPGGSGQQPFLRYRDWTLAGRLALWAGLSDHAYEELVGGFDSRLARVDGKGLHRTPFGPRPDLAKATGLPGLDLWVKDETGQVGGSHKARHLVGVMLYLLVLEAAALPAGEGVRSRPLAIASCGNAALAAAIVARAADWPLDVYIPDDAEKAVVKRLQGLGARLHVCQRDATIAGDPCFHAFRAAVAVGAIPFGVQGPENGLGVEGSRTLAYEMAEDLSRAGTALDAVYIQVGGGALGSGLAHGFAEMEAMGVIDRCPTFFAVEAEGCRPLAVAYERLEAWRRANGGEAGVALAHAAQHRADFMAPWPEPPRSIAHGILDDETYDWLGVMEAMLDTGGKPVIATEAQLADAHGFARKAGFRASHTGTAGLAGVLAAAPKNARVGVIFSGVER